MNTGRKPTHLGPTQPISPNRELALMEANSREYFFKLPLLDLSVRQPKAKGIQWIFGIVGQVGFLVMHRFH